MKRGRFITLEGLDGSGKTTAVEVVRTFLEQRGIPLVVTREPGGTPLGEDVREVLLVNRRNQSIDALSETLLLFGARAQHVKFVIGPALADGRWVMSDRFTDATLAYQGYGRRVSLKAIEFLARMVHPGLEPDLTFYLDLPVDQALARISGSEQPEADRQFRLFDDPLDRFEHERVEFFESVRRGYLEVARRDERVRVIDASQSLGSVSVAIEEHLTAFVDAAR